MLSTREIYESQGLLAALKNGRAETGCGGGVLDAGGMWATPTLLSESGRTFLSLNQRADSPPEAAVCVWGGVLGFWEGVWCQGGCPAGWPAMQKCTLYFLAEVLVFTG